MRELDDMVMNPIRESQERLRGAAKAMSQRVRSERIRKDSGMRAATRPGILVVEDDALMSKSIWRQLQAHRGLDLNIANSTGAARRAISGDVPWDVICIDLNLDGEDGAELVHELLLANVPSAIVVTTGLPEQGARERLSSDVERVTIREKGDSTLAGWVVELAAERTRKRLAR